MTLATCSLHDHAFRSQPVSRRLEQLTRAPQGGRGICYRSTEEGVLSLVRRCFPGAPHCSGTTASLCAHPVLSAASTAVLPHFPSDPLETHSLALKTHSFLPGCFSSSALLFIIFSQKPNPCLRLTSCSDPRTHHCLRPLAEVHVLSPAPSHIPAELCAART